MKITPENAARLKELVGEMIERLDEFKSIVKKAMPRYEYQQFKYRTLGNLEPGLIEESEWITSYSSISLEKVAENAAEAVEDEEEQNRRDEKHGLFGEHEDVAN
jgi:hypothetical protein